MRNRTTTSLVAVLTLVGVTEAQYSLPVGWPSKFPAHQLEIDSSAPGLLPSGAYTLDLQTVGRRLEGRLRQDTREYDRIPFSVSGCDGVKSPAWARRATARGLPPASGSLDRRVELRIAESGARACVITGVFTSDDTPIPGGRPNPGIPDQAAAAPAADLRIRAAKPVPGDPTRLQVEVYNHGPWPSKATQAKLIVSKNGNVHTGQSPVPALAAKASAWIVVGAGVPLNTADSVTVRADDPNLVAETNELNNGLIYK